MINNTNSGGSLVIGFDQAKNILKVAYLLTAIDGEICEKEKVKFRALMRELFAERYADADVMSYLEDVAEEARKLIALRAFYSVEEEIVKSFVAKAAPAAASIMTDNYVVRCAFAIWISICWADGNYSKIERSAMKELQHLVNTFGAGNKPEISTFVCTGLPLLSSLCAIKSVTRMPVKGNGITDKFLAEVEKRVKKIGEIYAKLDAANEEDVKQNYKDMYDFEVEELKEFLAVK